MFYEVPASTISIVAIIMYLWPPFSRSPYSVSLEVDEDGNPKSPRDALDDGLPKLYVHHNAFLKVLGATVDVDTTNITPILYDKEGFEMDANAWILFVFAIIKDRVRQWMNAIT